LYNTCSGCFPLLSLYIFIGKKMPPADVLK
jgi:hypothetical protein